MGIEGGGSFERFDRRRSFEASVEEGSHWLSELGVTPETLERIREYPAHAESSTEYLVYMLLLGKLIEGGAEWDPQRKIRVRNMVGVLRAVGFPNMTEQEQESIREISQATTVNMKENQYEINPDVISDVRWIWGTFGLKVPQDAASQGILEMPESTTSRPQFE